MWRFPPEKIGDRIWLNDLGILIRDLTDIQVDAFSNMLVSLSYRQSLSPLPFKVISWLPDNACSMVAYRSLGEVSTRSGQYLLFPHARELLFACTIAHFTCNSTGGHPETAH